MHGTQKIGDFWSHIRGYDARQHCNVCGDTESMAHILTQCESAPVQLIWTLARSYWPHDHIRWPEISLGTILGCGTITAPPPQNDDTEYSRTARGSTRLLQILISESAHLIWVLRCERAMHWQNKSHTAQEARARWLRQINIRLTDDKIIATKVKRDKASTRLVKDTWEQLLAKDTELPSDWLYSREVLVGRRP